MENLEFESPSNSLHLFPVLCQFPLFYELLQSSHLEEFLAFFFTHYVNREFSPGIFSGRGVLFRNRRRLDLETKLSKSQSEPCYVLGTRT